MSFQNAGQQLQYWVGQYGNVDRTYQVIDWVLDMGKANSMGLGQDSSLISVEGGKVRQVKISYFPIIAYDDQSCTSSLCAAGTKLQPKQVTFNLTRCTATPVMSLDRDDIRYIDGKHTFSNIAMDMIASVLPQFRRNLATDMLTLIAANIGIFLNGNPTQPVQPSVGTTGQINPAGMWQIDRNFMDGGLGTPYILGNVDVWNWKESFDIAAVNTTTGQDYAKLKVPPMYYDSGLLDTVLGDTANGGHLLAIDARTIKYVAFSENAGIFATTLQSPEQLDQLYWNGTESFINGTMFDPVTGILLDFNAKLNPCGTDSDTPEWTFYLKHRWDIFFLPEVSTNAVGPAFNGILHYRTCVPVVLPCPSGTAFSPAIVASTYSWTPVFTGKFTLPFNVMNTKVGGFTNNYGGAGGWNVTDLADLCAVLNDSGNGITFSVVSSSIQYTGYAPISGWFNNGDMTFTFA